MSAESGNKSGSLLWLVCFAFVVAGALLIADAFHFYLFSKLTVRLGAALLFSAIALMAGKDKPAGIISIAIVLLAVVITLFN